MTRANAASRVLRDVAPCGSGHNGLQWAIPLLTEALIGGGASMSEQQQHAGDPRITAAEAHSLSAVRS